MATTYDSDQGDVSRRDFIYIATTAFAAIGAAAALWPAIDQMNPDASALSLSSTEVDLTPVGVGQAITVLWRGKPIFIRHRTAEEIKMAQDVQVADLKDPNAEVMALLELARHRREQDEARQRAVAYRRRHLHPSRLHSKGRRHRRPGPLRWLVLPMPWFHVRHGWTHPAGACAA